MIFQIVLGGFIGGKKSYVNLVQWQQVSLVWEASEMNYHSMKT